MPITRTQALSMLLEALTAATESGLLDELAAELHPDTINEFCDAVNNYACEAQS
jgi:hypothetical protein